eukprot:350149-Chlamydomonas_euryale.AAC.3
MAAGAVGRRGAIRNRPMGWPADNQVSVWRVNRGASAARRARAARVPSHGGSREGVRMRRVAPLPVCAQAAGSAASAHHLRCEA